MKMLCFFPQLVILQFTWCEGEGDIESFSFLKEDQKGLTRKGCL
jgi:hypothetical protein